MIKNFHHDRIQLASSDVEHEKKVLIVAPESPEGIVIVGLVSLGLLCVAEPTWGDNGLLRFPPLLLS